MEMLDVIGIEKEKILRLTFYKAGLKGLFLSPMKRLR
jgi:hypothetical protein